MRTENSSPRLTNQAAIVTGGGRGIGRAIAEALAAQGAAVTVTARSGDQLAETVARITAAGGRALAVPADVTDPAAAAHVVASTAQQWGAVDLLVHNAGILGPIGPLWEVAPEDWWQTVNVHLHGMALYCHAVLPGMLARRRGRIITVTSRSVARPSPYMSSYGCVKTAQAALTETLAIETQTHNIQVFAIQPGLVRTALAENALASAAGQRWLQRHQERFAAGEDVPPERAAQLVAWLASGAGDGLSGRVLSITDDVATLARQAADIQRNEHYVMRLRT